MASGHHSAAPTQPLRGNEWRAVGLLLPYLWEYRWRVIVALACLVTAKLANVGVPLVLKEVVDGLDPTRAAVAVPFALLLAYGLLRLSTTLFAELRDVVFVRVTQRAIRRLALTVFRHLHSLSLRFHLERQTGGVSRDIERGTNGVSTLLSYMLFSIVPVILEFGLVAAVLFAKFDWRFVAATFVAVAIYLAYTFAVSEWRIGIRRRARLACELSLRPRRRLCCAAQSQKLTLVHSCALTSQMSFARPLSASVRPGRKAAARSAKAASAVLRYRASGSAVSRHRAAGSGTSTLVPSGEMEDTPQMQTCSTSGSRAVRSRVPSP